MRTRELKRFNIVRQISAAALGVVVLLGPKSISAAPSVSVTSEGTSRDNVGDVATGWTSYLITVNADPGDEITEIDMGDPGEGNTSPTNGIFGSFLQDWVPAKSPTFISTPNEPDQNGGAYGLDSHILVPTSIQVAIPSPFENNNLVNPGGSIPANDSVDAYGTGTFLHGIFGIADAADGGSVPLAYVVIPSNSFGSYTLSVAEAPITGGLSKLFTGITAASPGFGSPPVPEPTSVTGIVLAAGSLLLGRRSRVAGTKR